MKTKYVNLLNGEKFYAIKCEGQTIARFPAYIDLLSLAEALKPLSKYHKVTIEVYRMRSQCLILFCKEIRN